MKTSLISLLALLLATGFQARAQAPDEAAAATRTPEQLNELLGPIALYPDPLVSLILPAATVPSDITLADRFIAGGGDVSEVEDKPWDSSVKALARYPETLKWLDDNLEWTAQVGDAFADQPADVMESIQALRTKAKDMGNLADTPEEKVVQDEDSIRIVPAQPDSIYVPSYDPEVVYEQRVVSEPPVYFSQPYIVGPWLGYDFDWHHHHLYRGEWHRGWDYGRHDRNVYVNNSIRNTRIWHVDSQRRRSEVRRHPGQHSIASRGPVHIAHPSHHRGAPHQGETIRRAEVSNSHRPNVSPSASHHEDHRIGEAGRGHIAPHRPGSHHDTPRSRNEIVKSREHSHGSHNVVAKPHVQHLESRSPAPHYKAPSHQQSHGPHFVSMPKSRSQPQAKKPSTQHHATAPKHHSSSSNHHSNRSHDDKKKKHK